MESIDRGTKKVDNNKEMINMPEYRKFSKAVMLFTEGDLTAMDKYANVKPNSKLVNDLFDTLIQEFELIKKMFHLEWEIRYRTDKRTARRCFEVKYWGYPTTKLKKEYEQTKTLYKNIYE